ncbi:MAG: hypothetical protein CL878_07625 [Dehalococcoidia bacterium]|nr:hypothetical protein [Dehalococcoidia bacterium]
MPEVVKSALLHVPAGDIFAILEQAERNIEWVPRMAYSERVTPGPTAVGTRFRFGLEFMGMVADSVDEVVDFEPNRLIRSRAVDGVDHTASWQLEPVGDDGAVTLVTYRMDFELPPVLGKLASRLFNLESLFEEQAEGCLENLRLILEEGEPAAPASESSHRTADF